MVNYNLEANLSPIPLFSVNIFSCIKVQTHNTKRSGRVDQDYFTPQVSCLVIEPQETR